MYMRTWRKRLCILLAFVLVGCMAQPSVASAAKKIPFERYGKLSVKGSQLVDKNNKAVQLKGVSSHGMS